MLHTTVHDRYQVGCPLCGFLASYQTRQGAAQSIPKRIRRHRECGGVLTVYDVMARHGAQQQWTYSRDKAGKLGCFWKLRES